MKMKTDRPYPSWIYGEFKSAQKEYTGSTPMLDEKGNLLSPGWARHMVFEYDRAKVVPPIRSKEWDFYQISNGKYAIQISFANVSFGGYTSAVLMDILHPDNTKKHSSGTIVDPTIIYVGGREKYPMPPKGDVPNNVKYTVKGINGSADIEFDTKKNSRTLYFKTTQGGKEVECNFEMDIADNLENITTVLPFKGMPTRFFMTMKQNCMPCSGTFRIGEEVFEFSKEDTFCCLDWGRVNSPHSLVWYWGNGSTWLYDDEGNKHLFGFEITWGIGDESYGTETAIFYDGKLHKVGAVDVEVFPKPDKFMKPWHFISEDGRFDLTMTPIFDNHSDVNVLNIMRMHGHQVHGLWNGTVTLDDGTKLEIKDMYAFCEYCENKW